MSVGWDVKWCPVSRITTPLARKRPFHWVSMKSRLELVRAARKPSKFQNWSYFTNSRRRYMTEILPIRRKTLSDQSFQSISNFGRFMDASLFIICVEKYHTIRLLLSLWNFCTCLSFSMIGSCIVLRRLLTRYTSHYLSAHCKEVMFHSFLRMWSFVSWILYLYLKQSIVQLYSMFKNIFHQHLV